MKKIIPSRYRYPLFFVSIMLLSLTALTYKMVRPPLQVTEAVGIIGFALLTLSTL